MRKSYNSDSARELAQSYKITLAKIPATRKDLKITVKNVKDYIKSEGLSKPKKTVEKKDTPVAKKGYHVKLVFEPKSSKNIDLSGSNKKHNLEELIKYYKNLLPNVAISTDYFENEKVSKTTVKGIGRIVFDFDVPTLNTQEVDFIIRMATTLDDDGNYPIQVLNGRIVSIDAAGMSMDEPGVTLLREVIVTKKITSI